VSSKLEQAAAGYRRQLAARERDAFSVVTRAYTDAYRNITRRLELLLERVEQARAAGVTVSPAWVYQEGRYLELAAQLGSELDRAAAVTGEVLTGEQAAAIELGRQHALGLVDTALGPAPADTTPLQGSWATVNTSAMHEALGYQSHGSPLRTLLEGLGPQGVETVGGAIVSGIAAGHGPRQVARELSRTFAVQGSRALTIVRTETMRAYRESTRQSYLANSTVVTGWTWCSALDRRTCPCCWAMHGTTHKPAEQLDGHPSCRCVMLPITPSWDKLLGGAGDGLENTRVQLETGAQRFSKLDAATQREVLGPAKHRLYQSGRITLGDVVQRTRSRTWGTSRREASVKRALENAQRRADRTQRRVTQGGATSTSSRGKGKPLGPMTEAEWEQAAEARIREIDRKWDKLCEQLAPAGVDRTEVAFRTRENARAMRQEAGVTRSGRRSGASAWKSTRRKTVKAELRDAGERAALEFLANHPGEPVVRHITGLIEEADALREQLQALRESRISWLHD
jgi:SPP1 gp7 family putative phage head morphogenesis protein